MHRWIAPTLLIFLFIGGCTAKPRAAVAIEASVGPTVIVREIQDKSEGSEISLHVAKDTMRVEAISPRGIGGTRLVLTAGAWPSNVVVHLRYDKDRDFRGLEGPGASLEIAVTSPDETETPLEVRKIGDSGFVFTIPATDRKVLYISWIDFYRE